MQYRSTGKCSVVTRVVFEKPMTVLWIRNYFFPGPKPTLQKVSDPDTVPDPDMTLKVVTYIKK